MCNSFEEFDELVMYRIYSLFDDKSDTGFPLFRAYVHSVTNNGHNGHIGHIKTSATGQIPTLTRALLPIWDISDIYRHLDIYDNLSLLRRNPIHSKS